MPKKDQTISIQVDRETKVKAAYLAAQANRTQSGYVRQLLRAHIREYEFLHGPIPMKKEASTLR